MRRFSKITTTQLARICGVSQGTVDRAIHDRAGISKKTKERILTVAKEYDYIPDIHCREQANSMLIGVVIFDLYNEYFSKLAMSLVNAAKRFGYSVIFQFSGKDIKNERTSLEYFKYIGVDGIVLFSVGSDSDEYKKYLSFLKKPIVFIGNRMFDFQFIGVDDFDAMRNVTVNLAKKVQRGDILYYSPALKGTLHALNAQRVRLEGFIDAMREMGKSYRIVTDMDEILDFGGIVCSTDYYALKVLRYLDFPKGIFISGFDNISVLKNFQQRILTVEYSTDDIAKECIDYILGRRFTSKIEYRLVYND